MIAVGLARSQQLAVTTMLIWGDDDPISPPRVGEHLAALLPEAELHVSPADHWRSPLGSRP